MLSSVLRSPRAVLVNIAIMRTFVQLRRMLEASGQSLPESKPILEINIDHPLVGRLSAEADENRFAELSNIVLDHAMLAEGTQLDNPAEYVRRMNQFLLNTETAESN